MLTNEDNKDLISRGITVNQLNEQLSRFATGFPYLRLKDRKSVV